MSSIPIAGQQYTVQAGDTLSRIAVIAYGDFTLWPKIQKANQSTIKNADIFTGQIINIPLLPAEEDLKRGFTKNRLNDKAKDDLTLLISNRELIVQTIRINGSIDTGTDAWSTFIEWTPGEDKTLDKSLTPYAYPKASVYIGKELMVNGFLYIVTPNFDGEGRTLDLTGFSFTADGVDSTLKPPYEKNNITLEQRANDLVEPLGIKAIFNNPSGGKFDRITANPGDKIFNHLVTLAAQRGLLVTKTPSGDMLFTKSATGGVVGTLQEGDGIVTNWSGTFNGRKRFNAYRAIGQSPGGNANPSVAIDDKVPRSRFLTFTANDTTGGNIKNAAEWKRSKQLADALSFSLPVEGWLAPDKSVWKYNTLINVKSETLFIPNGFTFLIRSVEFVLDESAKTAILQLVPPQVYTGEPLIDPWDN